jgi:hypothetical protein
MSHGITGHYGLRHFSRLAHCSHCQMRSFIVDQSVQRDDASAAVDAD